MLCTESSFLSQSPVQSKRYYLPHLLLASGRWGKGSHIRASLMSFPARVARSVLLPGGVMGGHSRRTKLLLGVRVHVAHT